MNFTNVVYRICCPPKCIPSLTFLFTKLLRRMILIDNFQVDNGEWELLGVTTVTTNRTYNCCGINSYMNVSYIIHLKRRPLYYFFNLLIPCALIGFLALLGFTLPPESGEKLSVGCTILFSLIVFLNTIGQSMPANSDTVPLLGINI